jgi:hypothetical protein
MLCVYLDVLSELMDRRKFLAVIKGIPFVIYLLKSGILQASLEATKAQERASGSRGMPRIGSINEPIKDLSHLAEGLLSHSYPSFGSKSNAPLT